MSKQTIEIVRANSLYLEVPLKNESNNEEYIMNADDVLVFTLKKTAQYIQVLLEKRVTGENTIQILPKETSNLQPGNYVYDIVLCMENGDRYTVVEESPFVIKSDVGYYAE